MASPATYTPTSDAMDRHDYGINKNRKPASTGGGRAWSDDEEVYLLQTRLQKMPYKHIAAHLKKTELACRLHYHQLSHGSNRRKRTTSVSSGSSTGGHSPILPASMPSPIHEHAQHAQHSHVQHAQHSSPTPSPPGSSGSYGRLHHGMHAPGHVMHSHGLGHAHSHNSHGHGHGIHLPSINTDITNASNGNNGNTSPRLPTILPKPVSMTLALNAASARTPGSSYMQDSSQAPPHSAPLLPAATFTTRTPTSATAPRSATTGSSGANPPSLRLDCSGLPPLPLSSAGPHHPVDMARLHAVYAGHRASFWAAIACEYGHGSNPVVLEQAWRMGGVPSLPGLSTSASSSSSTGAGNGTPLTPGTSPDERDVFYGVKGGSASSSSSLSLINGQAPDKTRISAILGIDANPRSPKEREMVRRLEEDRVVVPPVA
ncbi:hypothetical protein SBRCBS47491_010069 [Sporothrix bragantina]|uniref:Myb-like domain-containing protein n=1 Tax=Sporothrix bragantina TaxID=671064 RepID=A0ABP0D0V6_9PEZI